MRSLNIAHRGFRGRYPENSLLAFEKALEAGADGIELDVQLTKDQQVVVYHDPTLERLTKSSKKVIECTLEELQKLELISETVLEIKPQPIPSFEEYLEWVRDKEVITYIELKVAHDEEDGLEERVIELINKYELKNSIEISSPFPKRLKRIKRLDSVIRTGLLNFEGELKTIDLAKEIGAEVLHPLYTNLTQEKIEYAHSLGVELNPWGLDEIEDLFKINQLDVRSIITDFPDRLAAVQKIEKLYELNKEL